MKKLLLLLCLLSLCGCSVKNHDVADHLGERLEALAKAPIEDLADNNKPLYRYYIEPSVGRRTSTETSNVFVYNGREFLMNLDIAAVINNRFYKEAAFEKRLDRSAMIAQEGTYVDYNDLEFRYLLEVYDYEDLYFIVLDMAYVNFYACCEYAEIEDLVLMMMKIGKTVEVNAEQVVAAYSSKQTTEYVKEKLDLFEVVIPDSGRIEELLGISLEDTEETDEAQEGTEEYPEDDSNIDLEW